MSYSKPILLAREDAAGVSEGDQDGAVLFHDRTLPAPEKVVISSPPTRTVVIADEEHVHLQLLPVSGDASTERSIMLTPQAARELADALSEAAHYVDRSPQSPMAA
jgi:hypothetical protein